uniref:Uncharacterized protein n=1 Tax=Anguilla anguilla TaxID=7936 RepID=A0A0E9UVH6_ANGAN
MDKKQTKWLLLGNGQATSTSEMVQNL